MWCSDFLQQHKTTYKREDVVVPKTLVKSKVWCKPANFRIWIRGTRLIKTITIWWDMVQWLSSTTQKLTYKRRVPKKTANFQTIYDVVYESMVACGAVSEKFEEERMFDQFGKEIFDDALTFGRTTKYCVSVTPNLKVACWQKWFSHQPERGRRIKVTRTRNQQEERNLF